MFIDDATEEIPFFRQINFDKSSLKIFIKKNIKVMSHRPISDAVLC